MRRYDSSSHSRAYSKYLANEVSIISHYLALLCWQRGWEGVLVPKEAYMGWFGFDRMSGEREALIKAGFQACFPSPVKWHEGHTPSCYGSFLLSRSAVPSEDKAERKRPDDLYLLSTDGQKWGKLPKHVADMSIPKMQEQLHSWAAGLVELTGI